LIKEEDAMALRERATNYYYRINFDACKVAGLKVFVSFHAYKSAEEREKEKDREPQWAEFFRKLRENLHSQYTALLTAVETAGLTPADITDENGLIDLAKHPELRIMQDGMNELEPFERGIGERLFKYGDDKKSALVVNESVGGQLESLGFDDSWILEPILLDGGAEVYAGEYNSEPITHEFYYNRLKAVMNETEDC
jgi:hypothetical protein